MEGNFQTSFIPRKPLSPVQPGKLPRSVNFFSLATTIIFIITLALSAGVFGYKYYINNTITKNQAELDTLLTKFEPNLVGVLSKLDIKIQSVATLLDQHLALTTFFQALSRATLKSVRFNTFKYVSDGGKVGISMTGQAQSFSDIVLQSQEFAKVENAKSFRDANFSGLGLDKNGYVTFTFVSNLNPGAILFKNTLVSDTGINLTQTPVIISASSSLPIASTTNRTASSTPR